MKELKKEVHLYLSQRTFDALKECAHDRGGSMSYYIRRALQLFLLKGDYYRKAETRNVQNRSQNFHR